MTSHPIALRIDGELLTALDDYAATSGLSRAAAVKRLVEDGLRRIGYRPQTQRTGAEAAERGKSKSRVIADLIGATSTSSTSNEFILDGQPVTIRYASTANKRFGCYDNVRDRVKAIICAHEVKDGRFSLFRISSELWRQHGREASSGNPNRGRITFMSLSDLKRHGESLGEVGP